MPLIVRVLTAACLCGCLVGSAIAQERDAPTISLNGAGLEPMTLDRTSLSALPEIEQDVSFMTSKGEQHGRYRGPLLWAVLERAGLLRGIEHNAELRRTFVVTGRDGYVVAFSVGEIAPNFGNTPAIIALETDGRPLPANEGLRLIVPGDRRGARNVFDVTKIEVR